MRRNKESDPRVRDELRYHRDRLIEDYVAAGMDRGAAERRAFLEFGNIAPLEEAVHDVRGRWREDLAQDLRYTLRTWRRAPGFAAVAVLSLALGIGANAAIFSIVNAVLLRSLPVRDPGRLVMIGRVREGRPTAVSNPLFELLRDHVSSLEGSFALGTSEQTVVIDGADELVDVDTVSGGYFTVLGVEPGAGRLLGPADDSPSAAPAAVVSDAFWQRRFARSPAALGKALALRGQTFTIVGVTPRSFHSARPDRAPDLMLPLLLTIGEQQRRSADFNALRMMGRLKSGATVQQANAEVQPLFRGFVQAQAAQASEKARDGILQQQAAVFPAPDGMNALRFEYRRSLLILTGIVALVLLLACVNLSGLLLARAAARRREISIRLAIGAGRGRLIRQFLTESLALAVVGGSLGFAAARALASILFALILNGRVVPVSPAPDWRVLVFTSAISLLACCIMGLTPAWQSVRVGINPALKDGGGGRGPRRTGRALVVVQLAISMVLVVGATLFVATMLKLNGIDRGFDADPVLVVSVRSASPYPAARSGDVESALVDRLQRLPGVASVSAAQILPVTGGLWDRGVQVEGYRFRPDESESVGFNVIAPGYFATLGTPLLAGRDFERRDTPSSPKAAIVNETFARDFFGGTGAALGRHVTSVRVTYEIVGVVGDARYQNLRDGVIRTMYIPWTQRDGDQPSAYSYLVRVTSGDPRQIVPALDRLVRDADPALRVRRTRPYAALVFENIGNERMMAVLGGFFGALAIVIAGVGVFGVLAFQVARRTNELGIRRALGASRAGMMALVLRDVTAMVAAGVALGAAGAFVSAGLARNLVFGISATEPALFATAAGVLAAAAFLAAWLPARRAARVDPLVALRHE